MSGLHEQHTPSQLGTGPSHMTSHMKRTTRKLSGPAKDRFLKRFVGEEPGLAPDIAARLAARCSATFTSLRIRTTVGHALAGHASRKHAQPAMQTATAVAPAVEMPAVAPMPPVPASAFDPYVFGLVPVFQREGRDGLLSKLSSVADIDNLRLMAKTQQIVLPAEYRVGAGEAASIRHAIADAVARRIADRRAAAG